MRLTWQGIDNSHPLQMVNFQYIIIIMSGREVSRPYHNIILIRGFSPRRAVFILGAKWKALVRGWRRVCAVGGIETRFQ